MSLRLLESLLRGSVALLATPFLLLAVLAVGAWLKASGTLTSASVSDAGERLPMPMPRLSLTRHRSRTWRASGATRKLSNGSYQR